MTAEREENEWKFTAEQVHPDDPIRTDWRKRAEAAEARLKQLKKEREWWEERWHVIESRALMHDDALARAEAAEAKLAAYEEALRRIMHFPFSVDSSADRDLIAVKEIARAALASSEAPEVAE